MTIQKTLKWAKIKLKKLDSPQLDAEVLLSFVLGKEKTYLYTYPEKKLLNKQIKKFKYLVNKRSFNYPIAYLTHHKEFYNLNFYINNHVLIPRPETEIMVEQTIDLIKKYNLKTVADIGTGSGCIAISLKKNLPDLDVYASDIDQKALSVAKTNAKLNLCKIEFKKGNLLTPYKHLKIDIYVANLPYLSHEIYQTAKTIKHEPKHALFAKNQGLEYIESTIEQLNKLDFKPKYLLLEIDPSQSKTILKILSKLNYQTIIIKDLKSLNRTLIIKIK